MTESTDLFVTFNIMSGHLLESIQKFQNKVSGWQFGNKVKYFDININPFDPRLFLFQKN